MGNLKEGVKAGQRPYKIPRTYRKDEPEQSVQIKEIQDLSGKKFYISQIKDHQEFWRLDCSCGEFHMPKPGWAKSCQHIIKFMQNHEDVRAPDHMLDPFVLVTAARQPSIVAHLSLGDPDPSGFRTVYLMIPTSEKSEPWQAEYFIGLTSSWEGRWGLRQMVLEFLVEKIEDKWECGAVQHRPAPFEDIENNMTDRGTPNFSVMADIFDLILTGYCRACNEDGALDDLPF